MRVVSLISALVVGFAIGGLILHFRNKGTIAVLEVRNTSLEQSKDALQDKFKISEEEKQDETEKARILQAKVDELTAQLDSTQKELEDVKARYASLKETVESGKLAGPAGQPSEAKKPDKKSTGTEDAETAKLIGELKDLLSRIELAPGDRKLMRELSDKIWHLRDEAALKEITEELAKIYADALANDPDNLDLIFNQGNACGAELTYLQVKMKENPMVYGPKMGEAAIKALDCFNKVLKKNPNDNEALLTRGMWCYHSPGEIKQAEKDFTELAKRAKEQNFNQEMGEQVFLGMAMTYQKTGKKEQAQKAVEEGLGLYPQSEQLRKLQEQLQK